MNLNEIKYQIRNELQNFVGRNDETDMLEKIYLNSNLHLSKCVFITGLHRIGKTTFCLQFANKYLQLQPNKLIYIDFQRSIFATESSLLQMAENELKIANNDLVTSDDKDVIPIMYRIIERIDNLSSDTIVILDEIESFLEFVEPVKFIHFLRAFMTSYIWPKVNEGSMPLLLVLTKNDWQNFEWELVQDSPLLHGFHKIMLGNLDSNSSSNLFLNKIKYLEIDLSTKQKWAKVTTFLSGGHPFIIIHAANIINNLETPIEPSFNLVAEKLLNICDGYMRSIWQSLSLFEKFQVVSIVAGEVEKIKIKNREHKKVYEKLQGIDNLIHKGIISSFETSFSPLFSWWIASNASEFFLEIKKIEKSKLDVDDVKSVFETISTLTTVVQSLPAFIQSIANYIKVFF